MSKSILIVDDDASITSIFEFILQQAGYTTLTASSGADCLALLETTTPDLIFLDLKMPGMSGLEVFRHIQQQNPEQVVVIMTGYTADNVLKEALELGAFSVIYKPFDVEEVLSIIDKLFSLPTLANS